MQISEKLCLQTIYYREFPCGTFAQLRREFDSFRTYFVRNQQHPTTKFALYFQQKTQGSHTN